jgi:hypothetical protein
MGSFRSPNNSEYQLYKSLGEKYDALIVMSAGNDGSYSSSCSPSYCTTAGFPAAYDLPNILSVGSTNQYGYDSYFSNFGSGVDVTAPGSSILSSYATNNDSYIFAPGTSMAAPLVAGIASAYWARLPHLNYETVRTRIIDESSYLGEVDMQAVFFGSSSSYSSSSKLQEPKIVDEEFKLSPYFEKMKPHIRMKNIDTMLFNKGEYDFIGILSGKRKQQIASALEIQKLMGRSTHKLSAIAEFNVSPMGGLISVQLNPSVRKSKNLSILKQMLKKKWVKGFDLNQVSSQPIVEAEAELLESTSEECNTKGHGTTTSYPDGTNAESYTSSVFFGSRDDIVNVGSNPTFIATGKGDDIINGGNKSDLLIGDAGSDIINGGNGQDDIRGSGGDDVIDGGAGKDTIKTGNGFDKIIPSSGKDTVVDFDLRSDSIEFPENSTVSYQQESSGLLISIEADKIQKIFLEGIDENDFKQVAEI